MTIRLPFRFRVIVVRCAPGEDIRLSRSTPIPTGREVFETLPDGTFGEVTIAPEEDLTKPIDWSKSPRARGVKVGPC